MSRVRNTAFLSALEPLFLALPAQSLYNVYMVPEKVIGFQITLSLIGEIRDVKRNHF